MNKTELRRYFQQRKEFLDVCRRLKTSEKSLEVFLSLGLWGDENEEVNCGHIARYIGTLPGVISRILSEFDKDGLISYTICESDKRKRIIKLTKKGKRKYNKITGVFDKRQV